MEESEIYLCICAAALFLYLGVGAWGFIRIRRMKSRLTAEGKELPPPDKKFRPAVISSAVLLALPFLIYFRPFVTAVLEGCAVLGLYITLRERLDPGKD